jgi:16S rRNA (cytosine967-C5)-methyltransferase
MADRLLLDVPCSGMGVLRRNPDSKWKLNPEDVVQLRKTQAEILDNYSSIVKVQGLMVYATCSFMPSENEEQIESFLQRSPLKWEKVQTLNIDPDQGLGDGFFAQSLRRLQ